MADVGFGVRDRYGLEPRPAMDDGWDPRLKGRDERVAKSRRAWGASIAARHRRATALPTTQPRRTMRSPCGPARAVQLAYFTSDQAEKVYLW